MRSDNRANTGWIEFLLVLSIVGIAFDELGNFNLGVFTLKVSLLLTIIASGIALARGDGFRLFEAPPPLLWIWLGCVLLETGIVVVLAGGLAVQVVGEFTWQSSVTKVVGLSLLAWWSVMLAVYLTGRQLWWAMIGLTIAMLGKGLYMEALVYRGQSEMLASLPSGLPRFSLLVGGMTPNQTGAIWLVIVTYWTVMTFWFRAHRLLTLAVVPAAIYFGVNTWSRSFFAGCAVLFFAVVIARRRFYLAALGVCVIVTLTWALAEFAPERLGSSINDDDRWMLWQIVGENFLKSPLIGVGFGGAVATHNTWLQLVAETGAIGTAVFAFLVCQAVLRIRRRESGLQLGAIIVGPYLVFLSVDIGLMQWQTWLLLGMIPIILSTHPRSRSLNGNVDSPNRGSRGAPHQCARLSTGKMEESE